MTHSHALELIWAIALAFGLCWLVRHAAGATPPGLA